MKLCVIENIDYDQWLCHKLSLEGKKTIKGVP